MARMGLWHMIGPETGTLVAETANDTTLMTSSGPTTYERVFSDARALPATYELQAGERYGVGVVCYKAGTYNYSVVGTESYRSPGMLFNLGKGRVMTGIMLGPNTDLPTSLVLQDILTDPSNGDLLRPFARLE